MAKKKPSAFDEFSTDSPAATVDALAETVESICVPNVFPILNNQPYRIAIIGDFPGKADIHHRKPFCRQGTPEYPYSGSIGAKLEEKLSQAGVARDACFIGTICQFSEHQDYLDKKIDLNQPKIQESLATLTTDLEKYNPNVCLLLGRAALYAAKGTTNIDAWRGSVFISDVPGPFYGRKCIATNHPRVCQAQYSLMPLLTFDIAKVAKEGRTPTFVPPVRNLRINLTAQETVDELIKIKQTKPKIALDIEGYVDAMSCLSISPDPSYAFIVVLANKNNTNYWDNEDDELRIWRALADVLEDSSILKVLQNSLYDRFVLQYSYGLIVRGVVDDTMLRHWELYCEFEKNLGFQCSIYTQEPYYKQERKDPDLDTFHRYCCRDSAVTLEINERLSKFLQPSQDAHYRFNVALLNPLMYMENRGILYDKPAAEACLKIVEEHLAVLQSKLDSLTGKGCPTYESLHELLAKVQEVMCYKKDREQPKKDYVEIYPRIRQMLATCVAEGRQPSTTELNYISVESDFSMNIRAPMFREYLYGPLGLPEQRKKNDRDEWVITADYEALLKLQKIKPTEVVDLAIQIGVLRTRSQMLGISADADGRVRCGYNVVGTETGRLTCYTSPTGSGYNLQTIPDKDKSKPDGHPLREGMRHLFKADPGYHMFQCDLSGADGWTIGANLAALGDRTMLDDLRAKIKPAAKICYMLRHGNNSLLGKSREEQKELLKEIKKEDWDYFACKQGIWGTCYLMGHDTLIKVIAIQSEGKMWLSKKEVADFQNAVFSAYKVKLWQDWMQRKLSTKPELVACNGFKRRFFARPNEALGQALSHEPQVITTYATNQAMHKLWRDPENRIINQSDSVGISNANRCRLRIEPLHQVHDALIGQFKIEDTSWAVDRIKSYFDNPVVVAGIKLIIPFEGNYGESWGNLNAGTI